MGKRLSREYFEDIYAQSTDPWDFETSLYERDKYKRTLEVLAHKRYHRALEVGCSIGVFTVMLAPLCAELVAVDIAEKAVVATRERIANFPNVRVERRTLPEETPEGPFDLIVASEVLYYLPKDMVLVALQRFEDMLAPGGVFLAVHLRGGWDPHRFKNQTAILAILGSYILAWLGSQELAIGGERSPRAAR